MTLKASNYPTVRPSLDLNFAQTKQLDPRITYSRASSGTYYDSTGLLKSAAANEARFDHDPTTGESLGLLVEEARTNLQTNSTSAALFTPTELTINPNALLAPDGSLTACSLIGNTATSYKYALNPVGFSVSGTTYTFSFYAKSIGSHTKITVGGTSTAWGTGSTTFDLSAVTATGTGGFTGSITAVGNGWYRCVATKAASASGYGLNFYLDLSNFQGDGTSGIGIWGIQAEAGAFPTSYIPTPATFTSRASTATYYDANGTIQTAGINVARDNAYFPDENGVFKPAGLLLEGAGTNLQTNSEDLSSYVNVGVTWTTNNVVAPDGQTTADTPSTDNFPLILGVYVNSTFIGVNASEVTNSWKRFSITFTPNGSQSINTYPLLNAGANIYTRGVTPTISTTHTYSGYFKKVGTTIIPWGLQLEASSYATSYIPTTSSTVTRAADVSSSSTATRSADVTQITGTNFSSWYNQSEGTLYQDCTPRANATGLGSNAAVGAVMTAAPNTQIGLYQDIGASNLKAVVYTQFEGYQANFTFSGAWTQNVRSKGALAYKQNSFAASANGATPQTDTSGLVPIPTSLDIGQMTTYPSSRIGAGTFSRLTYYPVRLPDATLQTITL